MESQSKLTSQINPKSSTKSTSKSSIMNNTTITIEDSKLSILKALTVAILKEPLTLTVNMLTGLENGVRHIKSPIINLLNKYTSHPETPTAEDNTITEIITESKITPEPKPITKPEIITEIIPEPEIITEPKIIPDNNIIDTPIDTPSDTPTDIPTITPTIITPDTQITNVPTDTQIITPIITPDITTNTQITNVTPKSIEAVTPKSTYESFHDGKHTLYITSVGNYSHSNLIEFNEGMSKTIKQLKTRLTKLNKLAIKNPNSQVKQDPSERTSIYLSATQMIKIITSDLSKSQHKLDHLQNCLRYVNTLNLNESKLN